MNSIKAKTCGRCFKPFKLNLLDNHVWSTRHKYKGRIDNPGVSCSVTFHNAENNQPVALCEKCQKKTISEMTNGGNWKG